MYCFGYHSRLMLLPYHVLANVIAFALAVDVKTTTVSSVPTKKASNIIKQKLEEDQELNQRTALTIENIISLLEFCITSTYFSFQGKFYEQVEGAAMGSPLSPIVANIYMESFEVEALRSAPQPPVMWKICG